MTGLAIHELQKAIYTTLSGNAPLMAKITGVYDEADENAALPIVVIGDGTSTDNSTKTEIGQDTTLTLHAWSGAGGRMEIKEIMGLLFNALEGAGLTLSGHSLIFLRFEFSEDFREVEGKRNLYHGVMRFRALTQKI